MAAEGDRLGDGVDNKDLKEIGGPVVSRPIKVLYSIM
jgi:hypothetical protein